MSLFICCHFCISLSFPGSFPSALPLLHSCAQFPLQTSLMSSSTFFIDQVVPIVVVVVVIVVVVVVIVRVVVVVKNLLNFVHTITRQSKALIYETLSFWHLGVHLLNKGCLNCSLLVQPVSLHSYTS